MSPSLPLGSVSAATFHLLDDYETQELLATCSKPTFSKGGTPGFASAIPASTTSPSDEAPPAAGGTTQGPRKGGVTPGIDPKAKRSYGEPRPGPSPGNFSTGDSGIPFTDVELNGTEAGLSCKTFDIVAKSFIAPIKDIGSAPSWALQGLLAHYKAWLLAAATNLALSENPVGPGKWDKKYRLYSSKLLEVCCEGNEVTSAKVLVTDSRVGLEPEPRGLHPPKGSFSDTDLRRLGKSVVMLMWRFSGRPNRLAEASFQAVAPRSSVYIWHLPITSFYCEDSKAKVCTGRIRGSRFPSHRLWIDRELMDELKQGPFAKLWIGKGGQVTEW